MIYISNVFLFKRDKLLGAKKSKKQKPAAKRTIEKTKAEEPEVPTIEDDNGMGFGGLPDRDLKKNLGGCG